ncbi:hypothetical protein VTK73DRAFT_7939 [Phialemonium thermophilum]|uniref:MARVEL domain-containing protein n=1 Tax=Phialemonium thermophilum TaxID=223376 RepID=A0ABR3WBV8_9PEZI
MAEKPRKTACIVFRILLFLSCIAILAYGNYDNRQLRKVEAELVALGVAGAVMALQVYWSIAWLTQFISPKRRPLRPLPYHYLTMVVTDILGTASWVAVLGVLAYWDRNVVYTPRTGDPREWFACHRAKGSESVSSYDGVWSELTIVWCEVRVDGKPRLIGNSSARVQLHALLGLAAGSWFLGSLVLAWVLLMGRGEGIWPWKRRDLRRQDSGHEMPLQHS